MSEKEVRGGLLPMSKTETKKARRRKSKTQTMNSRAERHLRRIKREVAHDLEHKYRLGHAEHNGDLLDMSVLQLIDEAISEATDQIVYLRTIKAGLEGKL